jgi:hypothetical protein
LGFQREGLKLNWCGMDFLMKNGIVFKGQETGCWRKGASWRYLDWMEQTPLPCPLPAARGEGIGKAPGRDKMHPSRREREDSI